MAYDDRPYNDLRKLAKSRGIEFKGGQPRKATLIEALELDDAVRRDQEIRDAAMSAPPPAPVSRVPRPPKPPTLEELDALPVPNGLKKYLVQHRYNNDLIVHARHADHAAEVYLAQRAILGTDRALMTITEVG